MHSKSLVFLSLLSCSCNDTFQYVLYFCNFQYQKGLVVIYKPFVFHRNNPTTASIDLTFEGQHFNLQDRIMNLFKTQLPEVRYQNFLGYVLGNLLFFKDFFTDFTAVPLTFRVLNLTWDQQLLNKNSGMFQGHAKLFCADVSCAVSYEINYGVIDYLHINVQSIS